MALLRVINRDIGNLPPIRVCFLRRVAVIRNVGVDVSSMSASMTYRIAGSLLALMIAFEMFQAQYGRYIQVADETARDGVDIHGLTITPFAFPLLVGPAELSIMITLSNDSPDGFPKHCLHLPRYSQRS
nr:MarC family protein [Bradyrhizobium elkanii]